LPAERGLWIAARCQAGPGQVAHTTPVYVTVEGGGFHNPETAAERLQASEKYLQEIEQELAAPGRRLDEQAWRHKEQLQRQIQEARRVLAELREKLR
jgi:metal-dependent hydrolase (beta-lactamase superfamily II)